MIRKTFIVENKQGLHARPAALFVQTASKFDSTIRVIKGRRKVNGKSIIGILTLGAEKGSKISIEAEGRDAEIAIQELEKILNSDE